MTLSCSKSRLLLPSNTVSVPMQAGLSLNPKWKCKVYGIQARAYHMLTNFYAYVHLVILLCIVILQPFKEEPPIDYKCKDKFLVQTAVIKPAHEALPIAEMVRGRDCLKGKMISYMEQDRDDVMWYRERWKKRVVSNVYATNCSGAWLNKRIVKASFNKRSNVCSCHQRNNQHHKMNNSNHPRNNLL